MTETGPLGEEAARLLAAAQEWLHRTVLDPATARVATGSPDCCWCPLCQLVAAARGDRPELAERLAVGLAAMTELQGALAGLLRSVTEAAGTAAAGAGTSQPAADQPPADERPADERPTRTVQRIDLSEPDSQPDPEPDPDSELGPEPDPELEAGQASPAGDGG